MKQKLTVLLAALMLVLAACVPGLGTMEPLTVSVLDEGTAVVVFTPQVDVVDVIIFIGGANTVESEHVAFAFECEPYRQGHRCFVPGQEQGTEPRFISPAGHPITITARSPNPAGVSGSAYWNPAR